MNKYKLVVFDLDGTLLDTSEGIMSSVRYAIEKTGRNMLSSEEIAAFIGPPIQDSFAAAYGLDKSAANEMAKVFRERYSSEDLLLAKPYEGIYDLLQELSVRGTKTAVATYKREDYAVRLLKSYHFDEYMDTMYGSDMEGLLKKQDIIEKCIAAAGVTKEQVLMVGDTFNDEVGAEKLGVDFAAVSYGFGYKKAEDVPKKENIIGCADTPLGLLNLV